MPAAAPSRSRPLWWTALALTALGCTGRPADPPAQKAVPPSATPTPHRPAPPAPAPPPSKSLAQRVREAEEELVAVGKRAQDRIDPAEVRREFDLMSKAMQGKIIELRADLAKRRIRDMPDELQTMFVLVNWPNQFDLQLLGRRFMEHADDCGAQQVLDDLKATDPKKIAWFKYHFGRMYGEPQRKRIRDISERVRRLGLANIPDEDKAVISEHPEYFPLP